MSDAGWRKRYEGKELPPNERPRTKRAARATEGGGGISGSGMSREFLNYLASIQKVEPKLEAKPGQQDVEEALERLARQRALGSPQELEPGRSGARLAQIEQATGKTPPWKGGLGDYTPESFKTAPEKKTFFSHEGGNHPVEHEKISYTPRQIGHPIRPNREVAGIKPEVHEGVGESGGLRKRLEERGAELDENISRAELGDEIDWMKRENELRAKSKPNPEPKTPGEESIKYRIGKFIDKHGHRGMTGYTGLDNDLEGAEEDFLGFAGKGDEARRLTGEHIQEAYEDPGAVNEADVRRKELAVNPDIAASLLNEAVMGSDRAAPPLSSDSDKESVGNGLNIHPVRKQIMLGMAHPMDSFADVERRIDSERGPVKESMAERAARIRSRAMSLRGLPDRKNPPPLEGSKEPSKPIKKTEPAGAGSIQDIYLPLRTSKQTIDESIARSGFKDAQQKQAVARGKDAHLGKIRIQRTHPIIPEAAARIAKRGPHRQHVSLLPETTTPRRMATPMPVQAPEERIPVNPTGTRLHPNIVQGLLPVQQYPQLNEFASTGTPHEKLIEQTKALPHVDWKQVRGRVEARRNAMRKAKKEGK